MSDQTPRDETDLDDDTTLESVEDNDSDDIEPPSDDQPGSSPSGSGDWTEGDDSASSPA